MNDLNVRKGFERKEKTFMLYSTPIYRSLSSSPVKQHQQSTSRDLNKYLSSNNSRLNQKKKQQQQHKQVKQAKMTATNVHLFSLFAMLITLLLNISTAKQASGAIFSNAQYSQTTCDTTRLIRCQQDVIRDMQTVSLNAASIQYPISGPPYSPSQKLQLQQQQQQAIQLANPATCRLVRSNLDCLLSTTPACYDQGIQAAQNTDIILRAKRFLEQNSCNGPDQTWQSTFCFRSPEIRSCEERYKFTSYNALSPDQSACLAYQAFKYCVDTHLRLNCKVHEMDMANEYLIDRASDLTWRCPTNSSSSVGSQSSYLSPYTLNNAPGSSLSPSSVSSYTPNNFGAYEQRPIPTYVGSQTGNVNLFSGSVREQAWERFRNPSDDTRFGISRYPGNGEVFDRLISGNTFDADTSDCPIKAAPYARECEDTLLEQQRLSRDSRDGNELQRRICCSLFQYRDCISRVVLDRCADSSPTAVEILMGPRRREMTITCRGFNRDICSGSQARSVLNLPVILITLAITLLLTTKLSNNKTQYTMVT